MEKASLNTKMAILIKEDFKITSLMAKVRITRKMVRSTKENGLKVKNMGLAFGNVNMDLSMLASGKIILSMDMVYICGSTETNTKLSGRMVLNADKVPICLQIKIIILGNIIVVYRMGMVVISGNLGHHTVEIL